VDNLQEVPFVYVGTTSLLGGNDSVCDRWMFGDLGLLNALSPGGYRKFHLLKDASETAHMVRVGKRSNCRNHQKGKAGTKISIMKNFWR
jgi:hypothetical protein